MVIHRSSLAYEGWFASRKKGSISWYLEWRPIHFQDNTCLTFEDTIHIMWYRSQGSPNHFVLPSPFKTRQPLRVFVYHFLRTKRVDGLSRLIDKQKIILYVVLEVVAGVGTSIFHSIDSLLQLGGCQGVRDASSMRSCLSFFRSIAFETIQVKSQSVTKSVSMFLTSLIMLMRNEKDVMAPKSFR